jgi:hypothetical protein
MGETIIDRQIRRCNRNLLFVNLAVLGALLLWGVLEQRYLYNCLTGPFPVAASDLPNMYPSSGKQEYFTVTDELRPATPARTSVARPTA